MRLLDNMINITIIPITHAIGPVKGQNMQRKAIAVLIKSSPSVLQNLPANLKSKTPKKI